MSARTLTLEVQSSPETVICKPDALSSMNTPINRLPLELLQAILKIVFPIRTRAHVLQVLRAAHVCRYWRTAAHSYTRFWSSIFIDDTPPAFVARCLELGGESLRVYVELKVTTSLSRSEHTVKRWARPNDVDSVNLLLEHAEHVRTLDVRAPFGHHKVLAPMIDAFQTLFPYVDRLHWADLSGLSQELNLVVPYSLPRLRHLSLYQNSFTPIIDEISGLKSLRWMVERVSARTFVELLQRNRGLESITVRDCVYYILPDDRMILYEPHPVSLPNLKSLTISNCQRTTWYLGAPLLSSLPVVRACNCEDTPTQIGFWSSSPVDPTLSLRVIVDNLEPIVTAELAPFWEGVTTFGLYRFVNPHRSKSHRYPGEMVDIWRLFPRLRVLEITWSHGLDKILQPLLNSTDICPILSRIEISPSEELRDGWGALDFFLALLESRAACGNHLSEVVLSHRTNSDGFAEELIPLHPRDWVRGYSSSTEEVTRHHGYCHFDVFWTHFIGRCQGFLRPT